MNQQKNKYFVDALVVVGLLIIVAVAYSNVFANQFLLDDEFLLIKNQFIRDFSYLPRIFVSSSTMGAGGVDSFYRPLQTLLYLLVFQLAGLSLIGFHVLNITLHAANVILIFLLGRQRLGLTRSWSLIASAIFAVHPLHTEAVTYMSATADPLHTLFILLSLYVWPRRWLTTIFFILALMSKEAAIVLPVLLMVWIYFQTDARKSWRIYFATWPQWLTAGIYLILRQTLLNFNDTYHMYREANVYSSSMYNRWLTWLATQPEYLRLILWPQNLHMERSFPVYTHMAAGPVMGGILLALALRVVWWERQRHYRPLSLLALWFVLSQIPQSGVLIAVNSFFLEHWMYLPLSGLLLGLTLFLQSKKLPEKLAFSVAAIIVVALGIVTWQQNEVWATPISFYQNILSHDRPTVRVLNNLGMAYADSGQIDLALEFYQKSIALSDTNANVHHNLAELLMQKHNWNEAREHLLRALAIDPRFYYSLKDLAKVEAETGHPELARKYLEDYEKLKPL